jgi:GNAT superfamily N-acetyltransferase
MPGVDRRLPPDFRSTVPRWLASSAHGALPSADTSIGEGDAEVTVFVDPDCWKHGVGRMLVDHEVRILRHHGREAIATWVLEDDHRALDFAEAMGWHMDGNRRDRHIGALTLHEVRCRAALV